MEASLTDVML